MRIFSFPDVWIVFLLMLQFAVFKNHEIDMQIIKSSNNQNEYENTHIASIKGSFPDFVKSAL